MPELLEFSNADGATVQIDVSIIAEELLRGLDLALPGGWELSYNQAALNPDEAQKGNCRDYVELAADLLQLAGLPKRFLQPVESRTNSIALNRDMGLIHHWGLLMGPFRPKNDALFYHHMGSGHNAGHEVLRLTELPSINSSKGGIDIRNYLEGGNEPIHPIGSNLGDDMYTFHKAHEIKP